MSQATAPPLAVLEKATVLMNEIRDREYEMWINMLVNPSVRTAWLKAWPHVDDATAVEYATILMRESGRMLRYPNEAINDALASWGTDRGPLRLAFEASIAWHQRRDLLDAMPDLYRQVFLPGKAEEACYMWWEYVMFCQAPSGGCIHNDGLAREHIFRIMGRLLRMPDARVQISVLHGLGHLSLTYPHKVNAIIDRFLRQDPSLSAEVVQYADAARSGDIL